MSTEEVGRALAARAALAARVDTFFDDVLARHDAAMMCARGCSACCQQQLTVCALEAVALLRALERLDGDARAQLAARARSLAADDGCALLVDDACALYEARPLVCRSHGLPVRQRPIGAILEAMGIADATPGASDGSGDESEEDTITCCSLNFVEGLPADALLDGAAIEAPLAVADQMLRAAAGATEANRFAIADLVAQGRRALPAALHPFLDDLGEPQTRETARIPRR